jgi:transposase
MIKVHLHSFESSDQVLTHMQKAREMTSLVIGRQVVSPYVFAFLLTGIFMFRADLTAQPYLFAVSIREMVADDSDVWLYLDLFDQLDIKDFTSDYVDQGQPGIDPVLMLRSIFYGLAHGVASGRKLAEVCRSDVRYMVLSGEQRPDFRTFHRFVERHLERMEELFVQVVRLAQKMGLVSLGRIAIDGSRVKANTSKHKAMSYGRMQQAIDQIKTELATLRDQLQKENSSSRSAAEDILPDEIKQKSRRLAKIEAAKRALEEDSAGKEVDPKSQKSFNDLEAKPMAKRGGEFRYGYNVQAAVDEQSQIIVAAELHDSSQDSKALPPILDKIEGNCGQNATEVLADAGYQSGQNLNAIEAKGSTPYVAKARGEKASSLTVVEQVIPTGSPHAYECRAGKRLPIKGTMSDGRTLVSIPTGYCDECPLQDECSLYGKRKNKAITIMSEVYREPYIRNVHRLRTSEGQAVYRRRKAIVEPVFGNIKVNKAIRILVKGRKKVSAWWKMAATAHNIEKIIGELVSTT